MTAIALRSFDTAPPPVQRPAGESGEFLAHLRLAALACRAAPRTDLFEACATLAISRERAPEAHARVLMRTLAQALPHRPRLHRPGTEETSFDEQWLVALFRAIRAEDDDSFEFLLRSRVPVHVRRNIAFLVRSAAGAVDKF
ncbi:hypothetical protein [Pelagovum pacificum]|uniref:Uncharacterized protein n=1 Tax=Pelagovum pacificum TaxID=2588711 RepID=A0A5C5GHZ6_9RHOB|nr:hypothetical protein [Pelagovum pacificum]QQA43804.1 hypothetical protein I8N54_04295 [Pelagovum pacificum]TNY33066.1 hypothetical protein FHY64_07240 [Pelagovum pacificum]